MLRALRSALVQRHQALTHWHQSPLPILMIRHSDVSCAVSTSSSVASTSTTRFPVYVSTRSASWKSHVRSAPEAPSAAAAAAVSIVTNAAAMKQLDSLAVVEQRLPDEYFHTPAKPLQKQLIFAVHKVELEQIPSLWERNVHAANAAFIFQILKALRPLAERAKRGRTDVAECVFNLFLQIQKTLHSPASFSIDFWGSSEASVCELALKEIYVRAFVAFANDGEAVCLALDHLVELHRRLPTPLVAQHAQLLSGCITLLFAQSDTSLPGTLWPHLLGCVFRTGLPITHLMIVHALTKIFPQNLSLGIAILRLIISEQKRRDTPALSEPEELDEVFVPGSRIRLQKQLIDVQRITSRARQSRSARTASILPHPPAPSEPHVPVWPIIQWPPFSDELLLPVITHLSQSSEPSHAFRLAELIVYCETELNRTLNLGIYQALKDATDKLENEETRQRIHELIPYLSTLATPGSTASVPQQQQYHPQQQQQRSQQQQQQQHLQQQQQIDPHQSSSRLTGAASMMHELGSKGDLISAVDKWQAIFAWKPVHGHFIDTVLLACFSYAGLKRTVLVLFSSLISSSSVTYLPRSVAHALLEAFAYTYDVQLPADETATISDAISSLIFFSQTNQDRPPLYISSGLLGSLPTAASPLRPQEVPLFVQSKAKLGPSTGLPRRKFIPASELEAFLTLFSLCEVAVECHQLTLSSYQLLFLLLAHHGQHQQAWKVYQRLELINRARPPLYPFILPAAKHLLWPDAVALVDLCKAQNIQAHEQHELPKTLQ